jgi:hypothetical protein
LSATKLPKDFGLLARALGRAVFPPVLEIATVENPLLPKGGKAAGTNPEKIKS